MQPLSHAAGKSAKTCAFTLVEMMMVVVIIGLLAAIAVPAFKKIREKSHTRIMLNDARQLAAAAQQYLTEFAVPGVIAVSIDAEGNVSVPLGVYVKKITKGSLAGSFDAFVLCPGTAAFTMSNPQVQAGATLSFDTEGQPLY